MTTSPARSWLVVSSFLWLAVTSILAFRGVMDGRLVADDAFYYFEIARNAALGDGFTFDGRAPTNGFHPLWAWLLVPLFAAFPTSPWVPVHIALVSSGVMAVASGWLLFYLFARRGAPLAGGVAAGLWLLNPFALLVSFRGMESALNTLLFALSLLLLEGVRSRGRWRPLETGVLGLVLGACMLARTENILWALAVAAALARDRLRRRQVREFVEAGVALCAGALTPLLPWIAWNLGVFGTLVQTSGLAKMRFGLYGDLPALGGAGFAAGAATAVGNLVGIADHLLRFLAQEPWKPFRWSGVLLAVAAVQVCGVVFASRQLRRGGSPSDEERAATAIWRDLSLPMLLFFGLHLAYYAWFAHSYAHWYFVPLVFGFCLWQGERLAPLARFAPERRRVWLLGGAFAALAVCAVVAAPHLQPDEERLRDTAALARYVPEDVESLGIWNAGLVGYWFSFHRPAVAVVNLDGVVNNAITGLSTREAYEDYLLAEIDAVGEAPTFLEPMIGEARAERFADRHLRCEARVGRLRFCRVIRPAGRARR